MELFVDIETIARPGAEALLPEPTAPSNYKDEAKIAAYIAETKAKQRERLALDTDCCQITTIAWAVGDGEISACDVHAHDVTEERLLRSAWDCWQAAGGFPVGYNIGEFDLPVLYRRSFLLGVRPGVRWEYRRYQKAPVLDLMQVFYNWAPPYRGLRFVCELCGITAYARGITAPIGDGADVGAMSPEQRIAHCKSDVEALRALYNKGKGWYW